MPLQLFTHAPHSYAQDEIGKRGDYNHRFGGDAIQFGYRFHDCKPLHLIYELDQSDPLCPSYLTGQSSLPLFYPFRYEQGCTYEVRGQDIRIVGPSWLSDSFPPWDAPETFPELPTRLCSMPYDPSDPQDVMAFKGVFGWDSLDEAGIKDALAICGETSSIHPSTHAPEDTWTYEQTIESTPRAPFVQGPPVARCQNSKCTKERLTTIALQTVPVKTEMVWPDKFVMTYWQICPKCKCIAAENTCT